MTTTQRDEVRDRELHDPEIHWLLNQAAAALGQRSAHQGLVSVLEHAGFPTGVPETDIYDDRHVGWGKFCVGDVERWRRLMPVWRILVTSEQAILAAHYAGARGGLPAEIWARVDGALGIYAAAALWLHHGEPLARLIEVCSDSQREGRADALKMASKRVEKAVRGAHRAWQAARERLDVGEPLTWQDESTALLERLARRRATEAAWAKATVAAQERLAGGNEVS
jgi:hypothetical protein